MTQSDSPYCKRARPTKAHEFWRQSDIMDDELFLDNRQLVDITRRRLPHWFQSNKLYFVTFRLSDSLPEDVKNEYVNLLDGLIQKYPIPRTYEQQSEVERITRNSLDKYLDAGYGSCVLKEDNVRAALVRTLEHNNGVDYELIAYVIMPNHVHLALALINNCSLQQVIKTIKRASAHSICKLANCGAPLWQREYYDRIIRNEMHLSRVLAYIANNPRHCVPDTYTLYMRKNANFGGLEVDEEK